MTIMFIYCMDGRFVPYKYFGSFVSRVFPYKRLLDIEVV